jgi:hypothetical protein
MYQPMYVLQVIAIAVSLGLLAFIIEATRRTHLKERYALLWLGAGVVLLALSVYRPLLDRIALALRVSYPPSLLFLVAFVFLFAIVLHYSLVLSSHRDSIRALAQTVALLQRRVEEQENGRRATENDLR